MVKDFISNHVFMCSILFLGVVSLLMQWMVSLSLKGYVKASANMKTTRKKVMINLRNQFEAIYGMDYQVRNIHAYVDKYLLKMRFLGFSFLEWEKFPFLTAGVVTLFAVGEAFYGYLTKLETTVEVEILFSYGIVLVSLFVGFHIFGIKSKQKQIQIQLVDYLENYLTNRLIRNHEENIEEKQIDFLECEDMDDINMKKIDEIGKEEVLIEESVTESNMEKDMEMLKRLIKEIDQDTQSKEKEVAASQEVEIPKEESEIELLEEFVQSFLA